MLRSFVRVASAALCLLVPVLAAGGSRDPMQLTLHTSGDDLRGGGRAWFVLEMADGVRQEQQVVNGEGFRAGTSRTALVAPAAPYDWSQVRSYGVRAEPHPGDGLALRPDAWHVSIELRGERGCRTARLAFGSECIDQHYFAHTFSRSETALRPIERRVGRCSEDDQCHDGLFCAERRYRCVPTGGDARGCEPLAAPRQPCTGATPVCNEGRVRCEAPPCPNSDVDGDGAISPACGGQDCDDRDGSRYPGAVEICDPLGVDEDCSPATLGGLDEDGDGFVSAACWNDV